jgi:hypothetical protein
MAKEENIGSIRLNHIKAASTKTYSILRRNEK